MKSFYTGAAGVASDKYHVCTGLAVGLHGAFSLLPHVVILLFEAVGPRIFIPSLIPLVVDAVHRVEVPLDGVPGGAPHLVDEVDDPDEEQEEETRQGGKPYHHIKKGVVLLAA